MRKLAGVAAADDVATDRLADLQDRISSAEQRAAQIRPELASLQKQLVSEKDASGALAAFDSVWETLSLREQARVLRLLVQRVDYDGDKGTVSVTFQPSGVAMLSGAAGEVQA